MKLKITEEENRTICQFVVDGLVCVISRDNNSNNGEGFVRGVRLFVGEVKDIEKTANGIKKEIETNRKAIDKRIELARKKMNLDKSHCYVCKSAAGMTESKCYKCNWYKCDCGACGCGYEYSNNAF